jgi:hypothetical protein
MARSLPKSEAPGPNVIKLFCLQFTNFRNKLECFVPGKLFQPNLMIVGKAWSLHYSGAPETLELAAKIRK